MIRKLLPLVGLFLCSCASLRHTEGVDVSLVSLRFSEATLFETTAEFVVRLENENPFELELEGAVHKVYLNGAYLGKGMTRDPMQVPGLGTAIQTVGVHLRNLTMASRLRSILDSQRVDYRIQSTLYVRENGRGSRVKTRNEGTLDFGEFQQNGRGASAVSGVPVRGGSDRSK